jgi:hypothetical protein
MTELLGNYIVNEIPVKILPNDQGTFSVLAYNSHTGEFERNFTFYSMIFYGREDIKQVTEAELESYIEKRFKKKQNQS